MSKLREQALMLVRKADADLSLLDEVLHSARVTDDIVGFHCQQAAEKLLKALLSSRSVAFPRTHSLRHLMDLLADAGQGLPAQLGNLDMLTPYGTVFRYEDPGGEPALDRSAALAMVRSLREHVVQDVRETR